MISRTTSLFVDRTAVSIPLFPWNRAGEPVKPEELAVRFVVLTPWERLVQRRRCDDSSHLGFALVEQKDRKPLPHPWIALLEGLVKSDVR